MDSMKYNNIALIRERRRILSLESNTRLGELIDVDRRLISKWFVSSETMDLIPTGKIRLLCKVLGLAIEDVMYFEKPVEVCKYKPVKQHNKLSKIETKLIGLDGLSTETDLRDFFKVKLELIRDIRQKSEALEGFRCVPKKERVFH